MKRYLENNVVADLRRKMVLLTGPRQVGKTWLAMSIAGEHFKRPCYLNYDSIPDARVIRRQSWLPGSDLIIFDEIHKMPEWKWFLKGVVDTKSPETAILVTGGSRMDTFRQTGDSLAGRYYHYRLWPFSVAELVSSYSADKAFRLLQRFGGFPEPLLAGDEIAAQRWRSQYFTDIVREDVLEFSRLQEVRSMRLLVEILRRRVGSPLSWSSLGGDLQLSPNTVKKYVDILEALHIVFLVRPYHKNIARAIQKMPKLYFYDTGYVDGDEGIKIENTTAVCLRKHTDFLSDTTGKATELQYVRTREKQEIDFAVTTEGSVSSLIEVKTSDQRIPRALKLLGSRIPYAEKYLLVKNLRLESDIDGIKVRKLSDWLAKLKA